MNLTSSPNGVSFDTHLSLYTKKPSLHSPWCRLGYISLSIDSLKSFYVIFESSTCLDFFHKFIGRHRIVVILPYAIKMGSWFLHHSNICPHCESSTLSEWNEAWTLHSPYSVNIVLKSTYNILYINLLLFSRTLLIHSSWYAAFIIILKIWRLATKVHAIFIGKKESFHADLISFYQIFSDLYWNT